MLTCRLLGHRIGFSTEGATLRWACERCGEPLGAKTYADPAAARRYAAVFDKRDTDDLGRRAPLIGLFPLRLWRRWRLAHGRGRGR